MKINVNSPLTDFKGEPVKESRNEDGKVVDKEVLWREIMTTALTGELKDEPFTSESKNKCYQIGIKINTTNEPDLKPSETSFLYDRINKMFPSPLICGRAAELLGEADKQESKNEASEALETPVTDTSTKKPPTGEEA